MVQQDSHSYRLQQLSHGRWFVPLLAGIGTRGARSVELRQSLGLSASMLRRSLEQMQNHGWIMPNPGHGHPLRPEWVATEKGTALVASCQAIMAERLQLGLSASGIGRWHLPLITQLIDQEKRFGELQNALSPVTPRALSLALKRGMALGQIERRLEADFPPMAIYGITDRARPLALAAIGLSS